MRLGLVTQVSPVLLVRVNGDKDAAPAQSHDDFSDATIGTTEVLVVTVENRRFAIRVS